MRGILLILLLWCCLISIAQTTDSVSTSQTGSFPASIDSSLAEKKIPNIFYGNQLKLTVFRLVDPFNPGIEIGYERQYAKYFSTQVSFAYLTNILKPRAIHTMGYRIAGEQKFFVVNDYPSRLYFSLEFSYAKSFSTRSLDFNPAGDTSPYYNRISYPDTVTVHKQIYTGNIKVGVQVTVAKHLVIDLSIGLGIKYINSHFSGQMNPGDDLYVRNPGPHPHLKVITMQQRQAYLPNLPCNLRIGYTF